MVQPHNETPVNPLPPVLVALFLIIAGIELIFAMGARGLIGGPGAVGWRVNAIQQYAFSGEIFAWMAETGRWPVEHLMRFVSYPFVHATFTHTLFAVVILLAIGKVVAEALGGVGMLAVFVLSGIAGALGFALLLDDPAPLVGAYPPVYGLIGGFTYLLWVRLGAFGEKQYRAFSLIGVLLLIQLIFGVFFGGGNDWVADLCGFGFGFALTVVLVPGGWQRLLGRIRR